MKTAQGGVALLSVLLLVAVMSVLLMSVLDDIRFGLRRASNAQTVAQAQWYSLGAEALAQSRIRALATRSAGRTTLAGGWNDKPFLFPLGEGDGEPGIVSARLRDSTACFNLNSVVQGAGEQWQRSEIGSAQYLALLEALEFAPALAESLAARLVDWIDSDSQPQPGGAEDSAYAALPQRTSGSLLAEVSELRALKGYDAESFARLRPHVCALPTAELSPVNINTLEEDDLVILQMLTANAVSAPEAGRILASRPAEGWVDTLSFWAQPALARAAVPNRVLQQVSVRSRFFALHTEVQYAQAQVVLSTLIEQDAAGQTRVRARRWGRDE